MVEDVDSINLNIFENIENIGITASASSPEILVKKLIDKLRINFDLEINEAHYQKENIYFKVPQITEKVVMAVFTKLNQKEINKFIDYL